MSNEFRARMNEAGTIPVEFRSEPPDDRSGWLAMPQGLALADCAGLMLAEGQWQDRPRILAPAISVTGSVTGAGFAVVFSPVPEGASCSVFDLDYGETLGEVPGESGAIAFEIAEPGRYQLDVTAPEPWLGAHFNVVLA